MTAVHTTNERPTPEAIKANYEFDEELTGPAPKAIGLFDDLLTTGSHFRAAKTILLERFPGVQITGLFVARRIIPEMEWEQIT